MSYDRQFLRFDFGFLLNGTDEIANTSISYTTVTGWAGAAAALAEYAGSSGSGQDPLDLLATLMGSGSAGWADYSRLKSVKVAAVGTNGHYLTDPFFYEDDTPAAGAMSNVPPQCSVVLSLRSGFTLGKANYGRMYLPHTKPTLTANTPTMATGAADAIASDGKTFVNALTARINDATTAVLFPAIMSQSGGGQAKGVTQVAVGTVVDTQRRRRNGLTEVYSFQSLA